MRMTARESLGTGPLDSIIYKGFDVEVLLLFIVPLTLRVENFGGGGSCRWANCTGIVYFSALHELVVHISYARRATRAGRLGRWLLGLVLVRSVSSRGQQGTEISRMRSTWTT